MRRFLGPVLVGLGVFFLVAGVLLRFYAYPRLAVAPIDQNTVTMLEATDATIFDTGALEEITTDLSVQSTTRGDVEASEEAGDNIRVWTGTTSTRSEDGVVRSRSAERAAFDATSGEAVNCCGAFDESTAGERVEVKREGLLYKFPFNTQQETYDFWDDSVGKPFPATFVQETDIDGLTVYEFQMDIPETTTGTREVPASVLGEEGTENLDADNVYSNSRTFWVEPVTGAIIDRNEQQSTKVFYDDTERLTVTEADLQYTDAQVQDNVEEYRTKSALLSLVHGLLPLVAVILGVLLLAVGLMLTRRRHSAERTRSAPAHSE